MTHTDVLAFSSEQVSKITRLSLRQLRYWDRTEFFSPEYAPGYRFGVFSRVYSFRDVVGLYTIGLLRNRFGISLQSLRSVGRYLHKHHDRPWASLTLFVAGKDILFRDPADETTLLSTRAPGQTVIPIHLVQVARHVEARANRLRRRRRSQIGRIERHRNLVHNSPVLAGTRIPTRAIWNFHEAGYSAEKIVREYPRLKPSDVDAAIRFESARRRTAKTG